MQKTFIRRQHIHIGFYPSVFWRTLTCLPFLIGKAVIGGGTCLPEPHVVSFLYMLFPCISMQGGWADSTVVINVLMHLHLFCWVSMVIWLNSPFIDPKHLLRVGTIKTSELFSLPCLDVQGPRLSESWTDFLLTLQALKRVKVFTAVASFLLGSWHPWLSSATCLSPLSAFACIDSNSKQQIFSLIKAPKEIGWGPRKQFQK